MKPKTLKEYLCALWPSATTEEATLTARRPEILPRHARLLTRDITTEKQELFVLVRRGLSLVMLMSNTTAFLKSNGLEIYPAPPTAPLLAGLHEANRAQETENVFLAMHDFEKKLGEVYHLIYYPESGVIIVYSYFGQLHWTPQ